MINKKISKKQSEILEFIKSEILDKGFPPSVREICQAVNLQSTSSVHAHLNSLEKMGYIRRDPAKPRCIIVEDENFNDIRTKTVNVPILGQISAGLPILAVENLDGYFPLPSDMVPQDCQTFMLQIKGESMINAGIFDRDLILVRQQNTAQNGDYVVAMIGDSVTCKTFYKEKDHIRLQPENDIFTPIITDVCQILGKVIGLFRRF
ncbi:MAG: transcriptional repressor LexA [Lachnospiraceae bacterium]|nr:transcriptional repressor LexA [Lachnospiraceae bacterium]